MTRISVDVAGELSGEEIKRFHSVLTRELQRMGLRGQVTTPPRFRLQQHSDPGNLTIRIHDNQPSNSDRDGECRLLFNGDYWEFTPSQLLDMMANPKRVFPLPCQRCCNGRASILNRIERAYQPGLWPDESLRGEIVKELREHFRDKGWYWTYCTHRRHQRYRSRRAACSSTASAQSRRRSPSHCSCCPATPPTSPRATSFAEQHAQPVAPLGGTTSA